MHLQEIKCFCVFRRNPLQLEVLSSSGIAASACRSPQTQSPWASSTCRRPSVCPPDPQLKGRFLHSTQALRGFLYPLPLSSVRFCHSATVFVCLFTNHKSIQRSKTKTHQERNAQNSQRQEETNYYFWWVFGPHSPHYSSHGFNNALLYEIIFKKKK